jgi:hypothetical protein
LTLASGNESTREGDLVDGGTHRYTSSVPCWSFDVKSEGDNITNVILHSAVDPEVIRLRTEVPSQSTGTRKDKTGSNEMPVTGAMHIIFSSRGGEACPFIVLYSFATCLRSVQWIRLIVENRIQCGEIEQLGPNLHPHFESRTVVFLKIYPFFFFLILVSHGNPTRVLYESDEVLSFPPFDFKARAPTLTIIFFRSHETSRNGHLFFRSLIQTLSYSCTSAEESSTLRTLHAYLEASGQLLKVILQIPPSDPSTSLRTAYRCVSQEMF